MAKTTTLELVPAWDALLLPDVSGAPEDALLMDIASAARECGISDSTVRTWVSRGHVKRYGTHGRRTIVDLRQVREHAALPR
ncbi:helix-turn-helix domain-containing protein [Streptomyces sp. NPDC050095]|uniref:helix-turn-helix domain-containing protein n=1 Tax=unclassified Streptomyces TaxID=2593676 RepID=UPI0034245D25